MRLQPSRSVRPLLSMQLALAALLPAAAVPADAAARPARCTLIVDGKTYIDGVCDFIAEKGGSFQIGAKDYFAYVSMTGPGRASASWNADPKSTHAQTPLGELTRDGSCWTNARTRICARDLPPERRAKIEAGRPNGEMVTPDVPGASQSCVAPDDGRWVAGARLVLHNCRPETDKGFERVGVRVTAAKGTLCVVSSGDGAPLELASCMATLAWTWTGTAAQSAPIRGLDKLCWAIPALDKPNAVFPFPVVAARCGAGGKSPLGFSFYKN